MKKRFDHLGIDGLRTAKIQAGSKLIYSSVEAEIKTELSRKYYWKSSQSAALVESKSGLRYTDI